MKFMICIFLLLPLISCSGKSGKEEKELATQAFVSCDFLGAKKNAELAVEYAGSNVEVAVPALLIIGKSSEFLGQQSSAYDKIVELAPGVNNTSEAEKIANQFVQNLSRMAPEKVKACPKLQS
jgi:hypothetical protein